LENPLWPIGGMKALQFSALRLHKKDGETDEKKLEISFLLYMIQ
jgi:hypothetical protein